MAVRCFWAAVAGFMAGVFVSSILPLGLAAAGTALLVSVLLAFLAARDRRARAAVLASVFVVAAAGGIARTSFVDVPRSAALEGRLGEELVLEGVVAAEPDVREGHTRLHVRVSTPDVPRGVGVLVMAPLRSAVQYGDVVSVRGVILFPQAFETGPGRIFDYPAFLKKDGISYELKFAEVERTGGNEGNSFVRAVLWIKQKYLTGLRVALPDTSAALAGGITVGDKRALGSGLSDTFRDVALIHIVVLSGYNIMVVINAVAKFLMRGSRSVRFAASALIAVSFVVMTGAAAPSVRAAAMAMIGMAGRATKRTYIAARALAAVALLMVLWNPYVLALDPGFQLSVAATWGIIVLTPLVLPFFSRFISQPALREVAATTVATQAAVLPLILYQSGTLSLYALPVNLLVLAALPAAMFFSALASFAGLTLGVFAPLIAFPAHALLSYVIGVATFFAALPFSTVSIGTFGFAWVLVAYALLLLYAHYRKDETSGDSSPV